MNSKTPGPSRIATAVSLSLFVAALMAMLLPAWNRDIMFSLLGRPGAHSGHAGAWAGAVSFYLYLAMTAGVVFSAFVMAIVQCTKSRNWRWFLLCEIVVFGLSIWISANEVLKDAV